MAWPVALYGADGVTPLVDHDLDGIPDTDRLTSGQSTTIVAMVTVLPNALAGVQDVTTVTASSGRNPSPANTDTATDTTTVSGSISLSLSASTIDFGLFSPGSELDPAASEVSSSVDGLGAHYMKQASDSQGAVMVTVTSNGAWTGHCWAGENGGTASTISVGDGAFEWSLASQSSWSPFTNTAQVPPYDNSCFASRPPGDLSLRLRFPPASELGRSARHLQFERHLRRIPIDARHMECGGLTPLSRSTVK